MTGYWYPGAQDPPPEDDFDVPTRDDQRVVTPEPGPSSRSPE